MDERLCLPAEWPPLVQDRIDRWFARHDRDGRIPARAPCGAADDGEWRWCSLPDAGPDELHQVQLFNGRCALDGLKQYESAPSEQLEESIAWHVIRAAVAGQLREWSLQGEQDRS